jgi:hypothetical protein
VPEVDGYISRVFDWVFVLFVAERASLRWKVNGVFFAVPKVCYVVYGLDVHEHSCCFQSHHDSQQEGALHAVWIKTNFIFHRGDRREMYDWIVSCELGWREQ